MIKICWLSDFDFKSSGYGNISISLCTGLANLKEDFEVKAVGLNYMGEEHNYPFSILPSQNIHESMAIIQNLYNAWGFDILVVALDIPIQEQIMSSMKNGRPFQYVGLMPIESDPLCVTWALILMNMDKALVISEFGTREAEKVGVSNVVHIPIGIDSEAWRFPTAEEKSLIRKSFGIADDEFVILTVADNQERKLLSRALEMISDFKDIHKNFRYVLVTREHSFVGWKLRDLATKYGITDKVMIFEKGLPFKNLWGIYAMSDVFLLTSKAEGLGMPLLEAQAVGVPCIGTNCTGINEILSNGRGYLIDPDYSIVDPFGNGHRYYANRKIGVELLEKVLRGDDVSEVIDRARDFVELRTWDKSVKVLTETLKDVYEQKKSKETSTNTDQK